VVRDGSLLVDLRKLSFGSVLGCRLSLCLKGLGFQNLIRLGICLHALSGRELLYSSNLAFTFSRILSRFDLALRPPISIQIFLLKNLEDQKRVNTVSTECHLFLGTDHNLSF
jgi:hypothetical protein